MVTWVICPQTEEVVPVDGKEAAGMGGTRVRLAVVFSLGSFKLRQLCLLRNSFR